MNVRKMLLVVGILLGSSLVEASLLTREQAKGFIVYDDGNDTIQLSVPSQFNRVNGAASCGYEAAFNGISIRRILEALEADRPAALTFLRDNTDARLTTFCANESPWRKMIVLRRRQEAAKVALEEQIAALYKGATIVEAPAKRIDGYLYKELLCGKWLEFPPPSSEHEGKLRDALWSETRNVASALAELHQDALAHVISSDDIVTQFMIRIRYRMSRADPNDMPFLKLDDHLKLEDYIDFKDVKANFHFADEGNWVDSLEILKILESERVDMRSTFICGHGLPADTPFALDESFMESEEYVNFTIEFQTDGGTQIGVFHIYVKGLDSVPEENKSGPSEAKRHAHAMNANSQGHWICMVAYKVGSERQFIVANSAVNASQIDHYRIRELKCLLQGVDYVTDGTFNSWIEDERLLASPIALFKRALEDDNYMPKFAQYMLTNFTDIDMLLYEHRKTVGTYLNEKLLEIEENASISHDALKQRIVTILELADDRRSGLPASQRRLHSQWLKPATIAGVGLADTDENLARLILQCAEHPARLEELKSYLLQVKETRSVELATIPYKKGTLADHYHKLSARLYTHKESVARLLSEHTLRELMLKPHDASNCADFVNYFRAHPCDISKVPYSLDPNERAYATLGDWLKAQELDPRYASMVSAVNNNKVKPSVNPPYSPPQPHKEGEEDGSKATHWLTREKSAVLATILGIGCYLLYKRQQQTPQKNKDLSPALSLQNQRAVV